MRYWRSRKTGSVRIDNVPGVAGAASGSFDLVLVGLLISFPTVVFGSSRVLPLVERFPVIIKIGAAVLAVTAAKMIVSEPLLSDLYDANSEPTPELLHSAAQWITYALAVLGVVGRGWWAGRRTGTNGGEKLMSN